MKKRMALTVVLLIIAAVVAVVGFVQKTEVEKKLTAAEELQKTSETAKAEIEKKLVATEELQKTAETAREEAEAAKEAAEAAQEEAEAKVAELTTQVETLTSNLEIIASVLSVQDKHGLGIVTTIDSVAEAADKKPGAAQVNTTVCSLVLDAQNKIKSVTWDVQQTRIQFSAEGKPVELPEADQILTQLEKGEAYGMIRASAIGKEWFEQVAALSEYAVGKTVEEMLSMPVYESDASHPYAPDVEDLKTSVTISVGDFLAALKKAADNAAK